jgi:uncharacterized protein
MISQLELSSLPKHGNYISSIELDLTWNCNLNCRYCYKHKGGGKISLRTAFDAIIWLIYASGPVRYIRVNFLGGEPLLEFSLMKQLVPFSTRRSIEHNKNISFGMTTNCTLITDEIIGFCKEWKIGFHSSIDGIPEIQNFNRPLVNGKPSSPFIETSIPKLLAYQPACTARSTVVSNTVPLLYENYQYFRKLGYIDIALVPAEVERWNQNTFILFEQELNKIASEWKNEIRSGVLVKLKFFDDIFHFINHPVPRNATCGVATSYVAIDIHGDIWPCSRWTRHNDKTWCLGNIYSTFNDELRNQIAIPCNSIHIKPECHDCEARAICSGGCSGENLATTGHFHTIHPNTCTIRNIYAKVARKIYTELFNEKCYTFMNFYCPTENTSLTN